ncbi:hypothetical protein LWI28_018324 [Acer negundo]|uniref:Uncharacterized protein n=1 Tax=Acer negundo TaxID=4023 RepID=A0AAD5J0H4_ACENE|nr:hypothetical protein LWI28_018324 [Acer negundo]
MGRHRGWVDHSGTGIPVFDVLETRWGDERLVSGIVGSNEKHKECIDRDIISGVVTNSAELVKSGRLVTKLNNKGKESVKKDVGSGDGFKLSGSVGGYGIVVEAYNPMKGIVLHKGPRRVDPYKT